MTDKNKQTETLLMEHYRHYPELQVQDGFKKEYAVFLPLFPEIDRALQNGEVTLAIEGGSASGKTTLSRMLQEVYGATVFHMDDFFLQPWQRTEERLSQPGENVDWERFLEEVLVPLKNHEPIHYQRFDCSMLTLEPALTMLPSKINIIEGAYSMHPKLAGYYNLSVFLDISSPLQKERIRKRNSPAKAKRFFEEWIPMEHLYFEKMQVKERCNLVIRIE